MANSNAFDPENTEWTVDVSKLDTPDRRVQLEHLRATLAARMQYADPRETVALSKELTRIGDMIAALPDVKGDGIDHARASYQAAVGGSGAPDRHLSVVREDGGN